MKRILSPANFTCYFLSMVPQKDTDLFSSHYIELVNDGNQCHHDFLFTQLPLSTVLKAF